MVITLPNVWINQLVVAVARAESFRIKSFVSLVSRIVIRLFEREAMFRTIDVFLLLEAGLESNFRVAVGQS